MITSEMIDRINTLYHKSKATGLTPGEKEEQAFLRREYIRAIRASLRADLNNISVVEEDGSVTDLGEKYGSRGEDTEDGTVLQMREEGGDAL